MESQFVGSLTDIKHNSEGHDVMNNLRPPSFIFSTTNTIVFIYHLTSFKLNLCSSCPLNNWAAAFSWSLVIKNKKCKIILYRKKFSFISRTNQLSIKTICLCWNSQHFICVIGKLFKNILFYKNTFSSATFLLKLYLTFLLAIKSTLAKTTPCTMTKEGKSTFKITFLYARNETEDEQPSTASW